MIERHLSKRIRFQKTGADGRNPDWNWAAQRWKDEADYYADDLSVVDLTKLVGCPTCGAPAGTLCSGLVDFHTPRRRAAAEKMLELHGPRFTKGQNNGD